MAKKYDPGVSVAEFLELICTCIIVHLECILMVNSQHDKLALCFGMLTFQSACSALFCKAFRML